jgi:hypothetical protein
VEINSQSSTCSIKTQKPSPAGDGRGCASDSNARVRASVRKKFIPPGAGRIDAVRSSLVSPGLINRPETVNINIGYVIKAAKKVFYFLKVINFIIITLDSES